MNKENRLKYGNKKQIMKIFTLLKDYSGVINFIFLLIQKSFQYYFKG